jgi:hypothetical protein
MAQQVIVTLVDDLDGGVADETLRFSYRGADYEIDLSKKNAVAFDKAIEKFVVKARKTMAPAAARGPRKGTASGLSKEQLAEVRAWAIKNKIKVSPRGRVAADIIARYQSAKR